MAHFIEVTSKFTKQKLIVNVGAIVSVEENSGNHAVIIMAHTGSCNYIQESYKEIKSRLMPDKQTWSQQQAEIFKRQHQIP